MNRIKSFIDKKPMITFWLIMIIQICLIIFWGCMKSNFHQDELYTMQSAHYINNQTPRNVYMHNTPIFCSNTWLNTGDFRGFLIVDSESSIFRDNAFVNLKKIILDEPTDVLQNIFMGLLFPGIVSKWPGIIMNIICIIIGQLCIFKLVKELSKNNLASVITVFFYGFSSISFSFAVYTRFYCYALMMISISIYLHYKIWTEKNIIANIVREIFGLFCLYQAFLCSEIVAVIAAAWFVCFSIGLFIKKRWVSVLLYDGPVIPVAFLFIDKFSYLFNAILHPSSYMDGSGEPFDLMFTNFANLGKRQLFKRLLEYYSFMGSSLFGSTILFSAFLLLLIILTFKYVSREDKDKKMNLNEAFSFYLMLIGIIIIFGIFSILVGLWLPRYHALVYPQIVVVLISLWMYLSKYTKKAYNRIAMFILIISTLYTHLFVKIDNVFIEDRETINKIDKYDAIDNVIWNMDDYQIIMECVYQMPEESRMYVSSEYEPLNFIDFDEEFLLWTDDSEPLTDENIAYINSNGYEVAEHLGIAADANIYYVRKIEN